MTSFHSTTPGKKSQSNKKAAKDARELTRDLLNLDGGQLAEMAAQLQAVGDWDSLELVRKWSDLTLDERNGVAAHFAQPSK